MASATQSQIIKTMQKQLEQLMKDKNYEDESNFSSSNNAENSYKKWAKSFIAPDSATRKAFLEKLTEKQRKFLTDFHYNMKKANNISQEGIEFFQNMNLALDEKRVRLIKGETKSVDTEKAALLVLKATIVGIFMVGLPEYFLLVHCFK